MVTIIEKFGFIYLVNDFEKKVEIYEDSVSKRTHDILKITLK